MGNVNGIIIKPFMKAYSNCPDVLMFRVRECFAKYPDQVLEHVRDQTFENHSYKRWPTVAEMRKYLPSDAVDKKSGGDALEKIEKKHQSWKQKAKVAAKHFMDYSDLGRQSMAKGWGKKLSQVVENMEWIRHQVIGNSYGIGWDGYALPIPYSSPRLKDYVNELIKGFTQYPDAKITFTEEHIAYMMGKA
tara:strand:+ start:3629 stop:4198 length:570 start_codon:yes stop_codon:yes gene_type:complete